MPNWCANYIIVKGSKEELDKLEDAFENGILGSLENHRRIDYFDFSDYGDDLLIRFDSAWSPEKGLWRLIKYCGYDAEIFFYEGGCDFIGVNDEEYSFSEGEWINNESLWDMFSDDWIDYQEYHKEMEVDAA